MEVFKILKAQIDFGKYTIIFQRRKKDYHFGPELILIDIKPKVQESDYLLSSLRVSPKLNHQFIVNTR